MTDRSPSIAFGSVLPIASMLAFCAVPGSAQGVSEALVTEFDGRCFYADRYAPLLEQGHVFADCDSASIEQAGSQAIFSFRHSRRERGMDFRTSFNGENWDVTAVRLRSGEWRDVPGECKVYRRDGSIRTLTCITTRGARIYVANFEVAPAG